MTTPNLPEPLRSTVAASLRLGVLLNQSNDAQWEASPRPKPREDTAQRAKGGHGDPTADIVLDDRRLALREAVKDAEQSLKMHLAALRIAEENLEAALAGWNGE